MLDLYRQGSAYTTRVVDGCELPDDTPGLDARPEAGRGIHVPPFGPLIRRSLLFGALAASIGLALLWAVSRVSASVPFPPVSLASRLIRLAPGGVATTAIEQLGHSAKPLLAAGVTVAMLVILGLLPVALAGRVRAASVWLGVGFFALTASAAYAAPNHPPPLPMLAASAAGALLYVLTWGWMQSIAAAAAPDPARRRALVELASAVFGVALGGTLLGSLIGARRGPDTDVALAVVAVPARIPVRPPFPTVAGLTPEVTSPRDHYVVDIDLVEPAIDADSWRLRVSGVVDRPLELRFAELQRRFQLVEEYAVLTCVSNTVGGPLIGNSKWGGVRLRDVLAAAGVRSGAVDVLFRCADGYTVAIPLARALEPSSLVAVAQGGRPLLQQHGFPCRIRVPSLYGMMNAKWVQEMTILDHHALGFWQQRGWSDAAVVRTESRIDTRAGYGAGTPGWIGGVAWAGIRGISRVEVSIDGGESWREAILHEPLSPYAWTQWAYPWTPARPGTYRLQCRATDGTGRVQDQRSRPPHPSGASGYHEVDVLVG